jgi:hypothetical protein
LNTKLKTPGEIIDELVENSRHLWIAHFCLGLASAFVYWTRAGTFTPHLHTPRRGDGLIVILETFVAWTPYLISGMFSRVVLSTRAPAATLVFIGCSVGVATAGAALYLNLFKMREVPSPYLVSIGVTAALVLIAALCSAIWRCDIAD